MTSPFPVDAPELIGVGAEAIVQRSKHLGLVWVRRMATVVSATDPPNSTIIFDADTVEESAVSMLGAIPAGTRVYVDIIPPGGNFIVGLTTTLPINIMFQPVNFNGASPGGNTTSAAFVNMPGNPSMILNKKFASTRIRIDAHVTASTSLANTGMSFGVSVAGTDVGVSLIFMNPANTHTQGSGTTIPGIANTGNLTITGRWRRASGGGTLVQDANDWFSMTAQETI